jgi:hypothetical protein
MRPRRARASSVLAAVFVATSLPATAQNLSAPMVCRQLQARYAELAQANERRDLAAILALRSPDFPTNGPNGQHSTYADMAEYSRRLVSAIRPPIRLRNTILTLSVQGDTAAVEVLQEFSRRQLVDSVERAVDTSVLQRERWRRMADGWRIELVDSVHDRRWFADGKRVDPDEPYDPNAPAFHAPGSAPSREAAGLRLPAER